MMIRRLGLSIGIALAVGLTGCSSQPKGPGPEALEALLRQEAEALKAQNENQDADLGVRTTWRIASLDVVEHPDDADAPWRGTVGFKIRVETSDMDGKVEVDEVNKEFAYVFNPTLQKWVFEYK